MRDFKVCTCVWSFFDRRFKVMWKRKVFLIRKHIWLVEMVNIMKNL